MLDNIWFGTVLYEIIYDKEPYILEWQVQEFEYTIDGVFFPYKFIGRSVITENMIGSSVFFSYTDAEEQLNYILGSVENG